MKHNHVSSAGMLAVMPLLMAAQGQTRTGLPWWVWLLIVLVIVLLFWWWLSRGTEEGTPPPPEVEAISAKEDLPTKPYARPDDLTRIEGIGPKISGVLQSAGITTYQELAEAGVDRLQTILSDAALPLADPTTWPEQARLAAAGQWGELETLQETLKGGRRA